MNSRSSPSLRTCNEAYAVAGYEQSVSNLSQVSLGRDGMFSDGVAGQMPTVAGTAGSGYTIALTIGI
ncbi:MAG: hypothetical protein M3Q72_12420 [Actinomycetota bacterium]|nr:hypothetical protein [Actinomycetota bacterium]